MLDWFVVVYLVKTVVIKPEMPVLEFLARQRSAVFST